MAGASYAKRNTRFTRHLGAQFRATNQRAQTPYENHHNPKILGIFIDYHFTRDTWNLEKLPKAAAKRWMVRGLRLNQNLPPRNVFGARSRSGRRTNDFDRGGGRGTRYFPSERGGRGLRAPRGARVGGFLV